MLRRSLPTAVAAVPRRPFFSLFRNIKQIWEDRKELEKAEKQLLEQIDPRQMAKREAAIRARAHEFREAKLAQIEKLKKFEVQVNAELAKDLKQVEENLKAQFRSYDRRVTHAIDEALGDIDGKFQHPIEREMKQEMLEKIRARAPMKQGPSALLGGAPAASAAVDDDVLVAENSLADSSRELTRKAMEAKLTKTRGPKFSSTKD